MADPVLSGSAQASGISPLRQAVPSAPERLGVLGTALHVTSYKAFIEELRALSRMPRTAAVDFTNTQIVTLRRHQPDFRTLTDHFEYFVPDGMPLIWCLNAQGARLHDRVYGPNFMRECILATPAPFKHYLLGGSTECLNRLKDFFLTRNPNVQIVGCRNGYFGPNENGSVLEDIVRLSPDFIWVGLGTPKQQNWIAQYRDKIPSGILLAVGFAFDVNAGTKPDAPKWMQRLALTWAFRMISEPARLGPRYAKYNFLFLFYLLWDGLRGKAWSTRRQPPRHT
jgi:N-acetylglucosaminyldiphosphoundecaprenol N-acetyl-beta-D-mannosaminyltransferase